MTHGLLDLVTVADVVALLAALALALRFLRRGEEVVLQAGAAEVKAMPPALRPVQAAAS